MPAPEEQAVLLLRLLFWFLVYLLRVQADVASSLALLSIL